MTFEKSRLSARTAQSGVYLDFTATVGVHSPLSQRRLTELNDIVIHRAPRQRLTYSEFFELQEAVYARVEKGELTIDETVAEITLLSNLRSQSSVFDQAQHDLATYDTRANIYASFSNQAEFASINELIAQAEPVATTNTQSAPFGNFKSNNDSAWQYVEDSAARQFLLNRPFIDDRAIGSLDDLAVSLTTIHNDTRSSATFEIPTDLMISAASFTSWLGRSDSQGVSGNGEKTIALPSFSRSRGRTVSFQAIKAYASHPDDLPPVSQVSLYVQPNGLAYAGNGSGDSHRIGAAILRGEPTIKANGLRTILLRDNYL